MLKCRILKQERGRVLEKAKVQAFVESLPQEQNRILKQAFVEILPQEQNRILEKS